MFNDFYVSFLFFFLRLVHICKCIEIIIDAYTWRGIRYGICLYQQFSVAGFVVVVLMSMVLLVWKTILTQQLDGFSTASD